MKTKISVLVPIYNSAKYLRKCLETLEEQTMDDLEFILVNDGSTDGSLAIMEEFKKGDERFIIIDKNNTGYGDSLNKAIELASGEYIGIVEPDDYCDKRMFETLHLLAEGEEVDIARAGYYEYNDGEKTVCRTKLNVGRKKVFRPLEDYEVFFEIPAIWSAIYRKQFLIDNNIEFLPTAGASYQDAGFNFKTLACAKKVVYTNKPVYYYRKDNPNSSVKDQKKSMAVVKEYKEIENFVKKLEDSALLIKYCQVAKFGAYHWNLGHLDKKVGKIFARTMKEEFTKAKEDGLLEKKYFPVKYWYSLMILLRVPASLFYCFFAIREHLK